MIRIFNHYVSGAVLKGMAFDMVLLVALALVAVGMDVGLGNGSLPLAGTQVVSFAACLFALSSVSGLYQPACGASLGRGLARALLVLAAALPLCYGIFGLLPSGFDAEGDVQFWVMAGVTAVVFRRAFVSHFSSGPARRTRLLIFGAGTAAKVVAETLRTADPNADIVGFVPGPNEREVAVEPGEVVRLDTSLPEWARVHEVDEIVVALTERRAGSMPLRQLLDCRVSGTKVHDLNTHFEKTLGQIRVDFLNASWLIFGDGFDQGSWRTAVKRTFDVFCSSLLLLLTAPLMAVTALLIKLESPGPVLYRQERVGLNGRPFNVVKFRSMRNDAEKDGRPVWATANDARVTRVGQVIRKLRIDELPQLFSVLSGDMSLVGPRPERPFFVDQLTQEIPFYALRHSVKPGVTGWAQVRYPYGATVEDSLQKLQFDLYYVKNHTLFLDLVVLMETVGVVLTGRGAR